MTAGSWRLGDAVQTAPMGRDSIIGDYRWASPAVLDTSLRRAHVIDVTYLF